MTTWSSDFSEAMGTPVQDCGSPADFWVNGSSSPYWWETDGGGHLIGGTDDVLYDFIYHVADSQDQSVKFAFERTSSASKPPQFVFRTTRTAPASDLTGSSGIVIKYSSGVWRVLNGWTLLAQVADAGYADGTNDPDGDEVRIIEASIIGDTITLTVRKGSGTLLGTASAEITTIMDAGNIGVLLNGTYSSAGDLTRFGQINSAEAVDGVGAQTASTLKAYLSEAWVPGTLKVYTGGAWVPGVLKRNTSGSWV